MTSAQPSALAALVHLAGRWLVTNPVRNLVHEVSTPAPGLLEALAELRVRPAPTLDAVTARLRRCFGLDAREAADLVSAFVEAGLLGARATEAHWSDRMDAAENAPAREWVRYWSTRASVSIADYSDVSVFDVDRSEMEAFLATEPPPPLDRIYEDAPRIPLAHPATDTLGQSLQDRVTLALFLCFGRLREARFLDLLPVQLKAVPSKGARHPFEAYLLVGSDEAFEPGLYHYRGDRHCLEQLARTASVPAAAPLQLLVSICHERVQWRYRHSWCYKDLYLDLGHVTGTLKQIAAELGLGLRAAPPPPAEHLRETRLEPLVEECVASFVLTENLHA